MLRFIAFVACVLAAFGWGLAAGAYDWFPYPQLRAAKIAVLGEEPRANSTYEMSDVPGISAERYETLATKARIVMAGDSITASGRWDELFPDASIINRGVPGDMVGGLLERADTILRAEPEKVFVMVGINDVAAGNTNAQILDRYGKLIEALQTGGAEVFVQAVITCRETQFNTCNGEMRAQIGNLNSALRDLAGARNAQFIDLDSAFSNEKGVLDRLSIDGIHPSSAGFEVWRRMIEPYVRTEQKAGDES